MNLLLSNKAEVIEEYDQVLHSANASMRAPSVVRLRHYIHIPHSLPMPLSRRAVLTRDAFTCQYCGDQPGRDMLTIDHVMPRSRGGRTEWENVVTACAPCNRRKGSKTPEEAEMPLRTRPTRPRFWAMALATIGGNEAWRKYLR